MKKITFTILLCWSLAIIWAQAPGLLIQKTFDGSGNDNFSFIHQTVDGGYFVSGSSDSPVSGNKTEASQGADYWVLKLDSLGDIEWQNTIGGSGGEALGKGIQTTDGGYILGGRSDSNISDDKTENSQGNGDYWVVKLNSMGDIQWQNTIGGTGNEEGVTLQQTADGGFIVAGGSNSVISGDKTENSFDYDYWIVKLDSNGNIQWQSTVGGGGLDIFRCMNITLDGGCMVGGMSISGASDDKTEDNIGGFDYWIAKLDNNGNLQWENTIGGTGYDDIYSIQQTSDGGYILGGGSDSNISGDKTEDSQGQIDYWVVKLDGSGNMQWQNTIGGDRYDALSCIQQISEGYILGGTSNSLVSGDKTEQSSDFDFWIMKTDDTSNIIWQKTIGASQVDGMGTIAQIASNKYIAGGSRRMSQSPPTDGYWVLKLGPCTPSTEVCNGVDDNCDGIADNGVVCPKPTGLTSANVTANTATVNWTALPCATSYRVRTRYQLSPGVWSAYSAWSVTATNSKNLTGLQSAIYQYQVQSKCGTLYSTAATGTFSTCQSCDAATGLTTTNVTASSATVNWNHPSPGCIKRYRVRYRHRINSTTWSAWSAYAYTTAASLPLTGLASGKLHQWQVSGECTNGWSALAIGTFTTPVAASVAPPESASVSASVSVFPNPSYTGRFTLELPEAVTAIGVYDVWGKMIVQPQPTDAALDLSNFPTGVYFLKATLENGAPVSVKLIRN